MPAISLAQTNLPDKLETTSVSFSPILKTTPSWALFFRPTERPGIRLGNFFFMDIPAIAAGLRYEFKDQTQETNGVETTENYQRFSEKVGFRSSGWVYNPALCTFSATLEPELSQVEEENSAGNTAQSNLFTPDYLLSATFLQRKPYSLDLYANHYELPSWTAFRGGSDTLTQEYGADIKLDIQRFLQISAFMNANLSYRHSDTSIDGFYNQDDISDYFQLNFQQQDGRLKTTFNSSYTDHERTTEDVTTFTKTFDTSFFNNYVFRYNNRIAMNGLWTYRYQELDTVDFQNLRFNERLNVRHSGNLSSFYGFNYNYQETNGSDESNNFALQARLEHLLFDNLTTTVGVNSLYSDFSNGQEAAIDPYLNLSYFRKTPAGSINLNSNWNYLRTYRDSDPAMDLRVVQNERHTLNYSQDSFLKNYNVAVDTIFVTNTTGTIQYIEGIDYQVEIIGDYVSIRNLSLGDIDNGQDVLVHYVYQQDPAYDDGLFTQQYSLSYTFFRNTTLQLLHTRTNQYIIDGAPPSVLSNNIVNKASIRQNMGWSDTLLEVGEFEQSSELTYQRWQITQRFEFYPLRMLNLSIAGYYGERNYTDHPIDDTEHYDSIFLGGALKASWRINRRLLFTMEGYTDARDDDAENTVNIGLKTGLIFNYRLWTVKLYYDLTNQSIENETRNASRLNNVIRFDIVRIYW